MAIVDIDVTVLARPTREALAEVSTNQISAGVGIDTRAFLTLISINETGLSGPLRRADAFKPVNQVHTHTAVITWVRTAVVFIDVTGRSTPASRTLTLKSLTGLHTTASVQTRLRQAGVIHSLTVQSRISIRTGAVVLVRSGIAAGTTVKTWLPRATCIQIFVTKLSAPVGVTQALPGFAAGAVHAPGVGNTLITVFSLPAI